jgi:hypothetical protein
MMMWRVDCKVWALLKSLILKPQNLKEIIEKMVSYYSFSKTRLAVVV